MRNPFRKRKDPFATDRWDGVIRSARYRGKERQRPWLFRQSWRWVTALVLLLVIAAGGYAVWFYYDLQGKIQEDISGITEEEEGSAPFNVLLVGSDSREGLTEEEKERLGAADEDAGGPVSGERADTLILAHIDPGPNHIIMVQFPRDLFVPIAGGGENKINTALQKGPDAVARTVSDLTGLKINHYAQVNIAGFRDLVDAIDGVRLCITEPVPFDEATGIEITAEELPVVEFDGERALRFVRSRNFPTGDFQRIQNQQKFLSAAIGKITSIETFLNLGKIRKLAKVGGENLTIDKGTDLRELYDIGRKFRSFDPRNYEAYTVPNLGTARNEAGSVVLPDEPTMDFMFEAIKHNNSPASAAGLPDVNVSDITVGVYNGSAEEGVAAAAAKDLEGAINVGGKKVDVIEVANADRLNYKRTVIFYDPDSEGAEDKATLIAAAVPDATVREGDTRRVDVRVVVGRRPFKTEKVVVIEPIELPPPGTEPAECRRELG
jgi:LCP family protein required for cell wall assembly